MESKKKTIPYTYTLRKDLKLYQGDKDKRNNTWLIFDPVSDNYIRISETEYNIIGLLSGTMNIDELFKKSKDIYLDISKIELQGVLVFLDNNNLLQCKYSHTETKILAIRDMRAKAKTVRLLSSYLFFRIPLFNPDKFLTKTTPIVKAICNKYFILYLALISIIGYYGLVVHWNRYVATIVGTLNYSGLFKYSITMIMLKICHELGHAYSAKLLGVRVRKFGIGFIIFFPRLYTDITDSWKINKRKYRMLVDSAGILVELVLGGLAVLVWLNTGPGALNTISYFVFTVTIISTVLVNGNPFIKYDGYYLLMDIVNVDNLQSQGSTEIKILSRRWLFGLPVKSKIQSNSRRNLIIIYGIASFIYRIFLYTGIILIVYFKFTKAIGIVLMIAEIYVLVVNPLILEIKTIMKNKSKIKNKNFYMTLGSFVILLGIIFAPLPWNITMPSIVDSDRSNVIYVGSSGYLEDIRVKDSSMVKKYQSLIELNNPTIEYQFKALTLSLKQSEDELDLQRSRFDAMMSEDIKLEQITNITNDLIENIRQQKTLTIKSPIDGTFILFNRNLHPGKWLNKGTPLGEVYTNRLSIAAYATEDEVNKLQLEDTVTVYLNNNIDSYKGKIININSIPSKLWPPSPLLSISGGPIQVLNKSAEYSYTLKDRYYHITIELDSSYDNMEYGRTGTVIVTKFSSIGLGLFRKIFTTIQKELTF